MKAGPLPLIRASGPKPIADFLRSIGAPVASHWSRAGLPGRALDEADSLIPLWRVARFVEQAARAEGLPDLGLLGAAHTDLPSAGEFQRRIARARTLHEALAAAVTLVPAHNSGAQYSVSREGDRVRLRRRMLLPRGSASAQIDVFTVMQMIELVRSAAGPTWRPQEVTLQATTPLAHLDRVEALVEARITWDSPALSITLPRSLLGLPLARRAPPLDPAAPDPWLASAPPADFPGSLRVTIESLLPLREQAVAAAAETARMSVRSLQRRLAAEGTSFSRLVDDVRFARACRMLEASDRKMIEIALELGYADPAHFTRAFRRWTSFSPREFRRMRVQQPRGAP